MAKPPSKPLKRCAWTGNDPLMQAYHDEEWGVPLRDSRALWEMLMLEGFQAGLSWSIILHRREAFRKAFDRFDPEKIAAYRDAKIIRLLGDEKIIRSRAKILATIRGARIFLRMRDSGEAFGSFVWSFVNDRPIESHLHPPPAQTPLSARISRELKARGFPFVGPVIVYAWMQAVGLVNDHAPDCFCSKLKRQSRSSPPGG